jgi:hypothetical protein
MTTSKAVKLQRSENSIGVMIGMSIVALWVVWLV